MRSPCPPARVPLALALALTVAGFAAPAACGAPGPAPAARTLTAAVALRERLHADSTAAFRMLDRGALDSCRALLAGTIAAAAAFGDPALEARARLLDLGVDVRRGQVATVLARLAPVARMAEASRDTGVWMWAMRLEAMTRNILGRPDEGVALARRWLALAERSRNLEYQAQARTMIGWHAWQRGDLAAARRELEWSLPRYEALQHPVGLPYTLNLLGNVALAEARFAEARALYERVAALSRAFENDRMAVMALFNLGVVEARAGDPARAVTRYREALAIHERRGEVWDALLAMGNLTTFLVALGRVDEAAALARRGIALAAEHGLALEIHWQRMGLADALAAAGRADSARALYRAVLAAGDSLPPDLVSNTSSGLARALADADSLAAALEVMARGRRFAARGEAEPRARFAILHAELLTRAGRAAEALAEVGPRAPALEASGDLELALAAWVEVARAERALGRTAAAERAVARATAAWEAGRRRTSDLELREMRGERAARLAVESALLALGAAGGAGAPGEGAAAFDRVQRFKTRTLIERLAGPRAFADSADAALDPEGVTAARVRGAVLHDGELLLEYVVGPDTSLVFAVTRHALRVVGLPGAARLARVVSVARELFAAPPAGGADGAPAAAAARLGARLLPGLADLVAAARAVVVAPDGPLHRVPFAALVPPGGDAPLAAGREVWLTPSATYLALLRGRGAGAGRGMFVFAGAPRAGEAPLAGAAREARGLADRYRDVTLRVAGRRGPAPLDAAALAGYRALHFASHAHADDQLPWRSGIVVGGGAAGGDSLLSAADIAAARLGAPVVVLSGCESAGGRARTGEGVAGLASAFLAAGAPVVVATLWPVDDRTTADFMARFYESLAAGRSVAAALAEAQARARARSATAHPFHWAGFVALGDGDATLPLARRATAGVGSWLGALAALAALAAASRARRRARE
uniref:CHAT domain-containing protein n=1 Tax=Eiseniibacteriota bacterium TaxID=2212470 RepID=A0A832I4B3_UNCEI